MASEAPTSEERALRELPPGLWERLRSDPVRAPEHIALAAAERHAPAAAAWVADKRRTYANDPRRLATMAKKRHASLARLGGAATGVGGVFTAVPDLVLSAWIQSRMIFFIAAAHGYDPHDPMRPAELLVLWGLYPDPPSARLALDGMGETIAQRYVGSRVRRDEALLSRLARVAGRRTLRRVGGRLVPGLAVAVNAVGNERETRALADRAIAFYGG